MGKRSNRSKK